MRTTKQRREHWLRELDKGFIPQLDDIANLITDLEDALAALRLKETAYNIAVGDAEALSKDNERLRKALAPFARAGELISASLRRRGLMTENAYLWTRSSNTPGEKEVEGISVQDVLEAATVLKKTP